MAKKYLLYIHNPKFQEEPEKSKLINLLLEKHYASWPTITVIGPKPKEEAVFTASPGKSRVTVPKPPSTRTGSSLNRQHAKEVHNEMLRRMGLLE